MYVDHVPNACYCDMCVTPPKISTQDELLEELNTLAEDDLEEQLLKPARAAPAAAAPAAAAPPAPGMCVYLIFLVCCSCLDMYLLFILMFRQLTCFRRHPLALWRFRAEPARTS